MDSKNENTINIDPDYVRNNTALRKAEQKEKEENKLTSEKLTQVLSEIFDKELLTRQKQLEDLEEKICKAQKLLHLLRYVLVTSYYNKKSLEITNNEEHNITILDNQNRIHPALKKLLGKNVKLDIFTSGKRRNASKVCDNTEASTSQMPDAKKIKLDIKADVSKKHSVDKNQNSLKNRKKTQHRLVIGNISKWMPSLEDDNTTHKWMMYVRGEKENPDISHIVEKVIFYLHPSYRPHDVVQVGQPPFHLSRRGWGEFPLRVQIFFKCSLNKPISIVHYLKLDKTYTGRQTLGNETLVDVFLHDDIKSPKCETTTKLPEVPLTTRALDDPFTNCQIKTEELIIKEEPLDYLDSPLAHYSNIESDYSPLDFNQSDSSFIESCSVITRSDSTVTTSQTDSAYGQSDTASVSCEHDYCHDRDILEEQFLDIELDGDRNTFLNYLHFEHSYSIPNGWENSEYNCEKPEVYSDNGEGESKLIFGLDDTYGKRVFLRTAATPLSNSKTSCTNGHIDEKLSANYSLKNLVFTPSCGSRYKVILPHNKFKSIGEALPFLFKRFPLWNELAKNVKYTMTYPFVATTQEEFENWNIGKQINSEWNRAREVKKILLERFPMADKWNTKAFFMYARSHGYSPMKNLGNCFETASQEMTLLNNCFVDLLPNKAYPGKKDDIDVNIDIVSNGDTDTSQPSAQNTIDTIDISDVTLKNHSAFVREAALDCGVVLKLEELSDGVVMNGAERMILEAVKCMAEGLIRRSMHHSICQNHSSTGNAIEITKYEIEKAFNERSELRSIKKFQMKKREMEFFT